MHRIGNPRRAGLGAAIVGALLLVAPASAIKQAPPAAAVAAGTAGPHALKTDPGLRYLVSRWNELERLAPGEASRRLAGAADVLRLRFEPGAGEPTVETFVRLADADAAAVLEAEGARIRARVGEIAVASIPVSRVMAIAGRPEIVCLEAAGTAHAFLDSSRIRSHVKEVHAGTGLDRAYLGSGVVVGVLDSGLDWTHPDFKTATGATRIKGLYDFSNGREWSIGSIDSLTCGEYDGRGGGGHGTHVTGTAAGGGRRNPVYLGIAPQADIVFVKGTRDTASGAGFSEADIVAGVQYIFDKARTLGQPCVVNLSLGGQLGAHDGTSLYEQALDGLTHPGSIIVAAAGNARGDYIHAGYTVPSGTTYVEAAETPWTITPGSSQVIADAWYPSTGSIRFGVAVYAPGNLAAPLALAGPVAPGAVIFNQTLYEGSTPIGTIRIDATTTADPNNGKRRAFFLLTPTPVTSDYTWSIFAVGSGSFDMWAAAGGDFRPVPSMPSYFVPGDDAKSVGSPATARRVISVGAFVTKTEWVDVNGIPRTQPGATLDAISGFSSLGPSGDGRTLPDLAAPGEAIVAPLAQNVGTTALAPIIVFGGGYMKLQGTSMAAPHVTGTVALMLEKNRYLTPENARQLLQGAAVPPPAPNPNVWGAGKLDAQAAVLATPPAVGCGTPQPFDALAADCPDGLPLEAGTLIARPNPTMGAATLAFRLGAAAPVDLAVYDLAGRRIRRLQSGPLPAGPHELIWDGTDEQGARVRGGVYFARLLSPSRTALRRLVVVR